MVRYVREEEILAEAIRSTRRGVRDVQRATGTEKARTTELAQEAADAAGTANSAAADALAAADQAAIDAAAAKTTADGRNRIYAQQVQPVTMPELPFVAGDLWYRTDTSGRIAEVRVWNGTEWAAYQMVAGSLLVPGSVGPTLISDGAVTTQKLAATAIDGMTVTGALLRTAASGQRVQLDSFGIRTFNTGNAQTAAIAASSGGMNITGVVRLQSGDSGAKYVLLQANGMQVSDDANGSSANRANIYQNQITVARQNGDFAQLLVAGGSAPGVGSPPSFDLHREGGGRLILGAADPVTNEPEGFASVRAQRGNLRLSALSGKILLEGSEIRINGPIVFTGDTDWATLPLANGFVVENAQTPQWRIVRGVLQIRGRIKRSAGGAIGTSYVSVTDAVAALGAAASDAGWINMPRSTPGAAVGVTGNLIIATGGIVRAASTEASFFPNVDFIL